MTEDDTDDSVNSFYDKQNPRISSAFASTADDDDSSLSDEVVIGDFDALREPSIEQRNTFASITFVCTEKQQRVDSAHINHKFSSVISTISRPSSCSACNCSLVNFAHSCIHECLSRTKCSRLINH